MPLLTPARPDDAKVPGARAAAKLPAAAANLGPRSGIKLFMASNYWIFLKWSCMFCVLVWLLIYWLSEATEKLPDFVYVNF